MDGRLKVLTMIAGIVLMHATGMASFHSPASAAALPKKPNYTNKSRFRIPFNTDATALQRMNTREIQLHVSRDSGATWDLAQTLSPNGGKFEFQSPGEGEYWFSVKTVDGQNQLHPPAGKHETGLIVVVDTTKPSLEISLQQTAAGTVQLNWRAVDQCLDPATLQAEYLAPGSQSWEPISLNAQASGEATFAVAQSGVVSVRGSIADLAGNVGQATAQRQVDVTGQQNEKVRPTLSGPVAEIPFIEQGQSALVEQPATVKMLGKTADREYQGPIITPQGGLPRFPQTTVQAGQQANQQLKGQLVSNARSLPAPDRWQPAPTIPTKTASMPVEMVHSQNVALPPAPAPTQAAMSATHSNSQTPQQRIVQSRRFQIGYEIENVGPSGVGGVELFITLDNGRKWWSYGEDADHKSPFDVELDRDGIFGFSIRGRSGVGLSNLPPAPGEPPAIVVVVDQTPPVVELLPVEQGRGSNANQLRIRWKIAEEFPADKPVSIQYALSLNGPWQEVSSWRDNANGEFIWTVGQGDPAQFFLRVTVRDAAGNIGFAETNAPIIIDLQRPVARIIEIGVDQGSGPK